MSSSPAREEMGVTARNIGGIDETQVSIRPGVNVLTGRNATNRTSFLQAVMAALGSDRASLKADAEEGHVELTIADETYTRTFRRRGETITSDGSPYLDDPEVADLFAFLLETNEARRAVERGEDLRDVIMRPVDTAAIRTEIRDRLDGRRRIDQRLDELEELRSRLPELERRRADLDGKIEATRDELADVEREIEDRDASVQETRNEQAELDERLDDLHETRSELEGVRQKLESEADSLDALEGELAELTEREESLPEAPAENLRELDDEIQRLRGRKQAIDSGVSELQSIVQFNEEMLDGGAGLLEEASDDAWANGGSVTDQLVEDTEEVVCWTCGSQVEKTAIESTVTRLHDLRERRLEERNEIEERIEDLKSERDELRDDQRRRREISNRIQATKSEIDQRRNRVETLTDRRERLTDRIAELEDAVERLESQDYGEVLELHREANELEFELDRLQRDRSDVEAEIETAEAELAKRESLEERREEVSAQIRELRTRVDQIEADAVEAFNEHMSSLLSRLGYGNLERVWIERVQREVGNGRENTVENTFDLHIVRQTGSGTAYEDTVDHLSESEREVIGLVFALAGYLTHDVAEEVPFMLLDSLEAIDSERIADMVDYMREYAPNMVVALLPEDARTLGDQYHYVREV